MENNLDLSQTKKKFLVFFSFLFVLSFSEFVSAHCPLCTIGAGAAAFGAVSLGFSKIVVALLIGGFSMSMGLWFARIIKKKYFKFQDVLVVLGVFLLTLIPLLPIFSELHGVGIYLFGEYGGIFYRTYTIDFSLLAGFFGGLLVFLSPKVSKKITSIRHGKKISFQGSIVTVSLLIIFGGIIQLIV